MSIQLFSHVDRLKEAMRDTGIDLLICFHQENTCYILNDFNAVDFSTPVAAILSRASVQLIALIHSSQEVDALHVPGERVVYTYNVGHGGFSNAVHWSEALMKIFATLLRTTSLVIGTEHGIRSDYHEVLKNLASEQQFVEIDDILWKCRSIKDIQEIINSQKAAHIANTGMRAAIQCLRNRDAWEVGEVKAKTAMGDEWQRLCPTDTVAGFGSEQSGGMFDSLQCYIDIANVSTNWEKECGIISIRMSAAINYRHALIE